MKKLAALFCLLFLCVAHAQQPIVQSGFATPGHALYFLTNGVAADAGTAAQGFLTSLGVTAQGPGICQNSAPITQSYNQICLIANSTGNAGISFFNHGTTAAFTISVNGVVYQFPFTGSGAIGPPSTVIGDFACWNNTVGTLLSDCTIANNIVTGPNASTLHGLSYWTNTSGTQLGDAAGNTIQGNYSWAGGQYFTSGDPHCNPRGEGAVGNGTTIDTDAFAACVTQLDAVGGGILFIPPGSFCLAPTSANPAGGIPEPTSPILIQGSGISSTTLVNCGTDVTFVTLSVPYSEVRDLSICAKGSGCGLGVDTFGSSKAAIYLTNCGNCKVEYVNIIGGYNSIKVKDNGFCSIEHSSFSLAYGNAMVWLLAPACRDTNSAHDQSWPVVQPDSNSLNVTSWQPSHTYTGNAHNNTNVVATQSYLIQLVSASCTSGSTTPTLKNYNVTITDGTCQWLLAGAGTYYAIDADSTSSETILTNDDMGCPCTAVLALEDSLSTGAPGTISASGVSVGGGINANWLFDKGANFVATSGHFQGPVGIDSATIQVSATWGGGIKLSGITITGGYNGINDLATAGFGDSFIGNQITGQPNCPITFGAAVKYFIVANNTISPTASCSINVASGASDYYDITNNIVSGVAVTDGGSGTHKTISGNN